MPKCPYCNNEHMIEDFFDVSSKETRSGKLKVKVGEFNGQTLRIRGQNMVKMWVCPSCDSILGFSEYNWASG